MLDQFFFENDYLSEVCIFVSFILQCFYLNVQIMTCFLDCAFVSGCPSGVSSVSCFI